MNRFFVYCHIRADNNSVFYVGKGVKHRINQSNRRSNYWKSIVSKAGGFQSIVIGQDLEERAALDLEVRVISEMRGAGCKLCNMTNGGDGVSGYKHPPELREHLRQRAVGNKSRTGQKASAEERRRVSLAQMGKKHSDQTKKKMGIRILCVTTGRIYDTQTEASKDLGLHSSSISMCCRGQLKQTGGYEFQYQAGLEAKRKYEKRIAS